MALDPHVTRSEVAKDVIDLALRFQEGKSLDPIAQLQLLESQEKFIFLLDLANGNPEALATSTSLFNGDADLHKMAAVNYLVHHCFSEEKDPWQSLGLTKGASVEEVKLRYHQMIKLFHPDRALLEADQLQKIAVKINHANQMLQIHHRLTAKDFLNQHATSQNISPTSIKFNSHPFNAQLIIKLLFGFMILSLVLLYLKFNLIDHEILISDRPLTKNQESKVLLDSQLKIETSEPAAVLGKVEEQKIQATQPPKEVQKLANQRLLTSLSNPQSKTSMLEMNEIKIKVIVQKQDHLSLINTSPESKQSAGQDSDVIPPLTVAVDQVPVKVIIEEPVTVAPASISQTDLKRMLINLMDAYNQGNLDGLMSLMGDHVKVNESAGKEDLRLSYAMLFAKSKQREMVLKDVRWRLNGNKAIGTMGYKAQIKNLADSSYEVQQGIFNIEVTKLNDRLQIVGLETIEATN